MKTIEVKEIYVSKLGNNIRVCLCKDKNGQITLCIPKYLHPFKEWKKSNYRHRVKKVQINTVDIKVLENIISAASQLLKTVKTSFNRG